VPRKLAPHPSYNSKNFRLCFRPKRRGLPQNPLRLAKDVACDVAIIGADVTGALAALLTVEAGLNTADPDRRDVAQGSTAGSVGFLQYEIDVPLTNLIRMISERYAVACYHACRDAVRHPGALVRQLHLHADFAARASPLLASRPWDVDPLRREFGARSRVGFDVEWWGRAAVGSASTLPHAAANHSRCVEATEIDAYRFIHGLLAAARAAGAFMCDRTQVTRTRRTAWGSCSRPTAGRRWTPAPRDRRRL